MYRKRAEQIIRWLDLRITSQDLNPAPVLAFLVGPIIGYLHGMDGTVHRNKMTVGVTQKV